MKPRKIIIVDSAANRVASAFGGYKELARQLGIDYVAVYRWAYPKSKRGTGGNIPYRWHKPILHLAEANKINITSADLINT